MNIYKILRLAGDPEVISMAQEAKRQTGVDPIAAAKKLRIYTRVLITAFVVAMALAVIPTMMACAIMIANIVWPNQYACPGFVLPMVIVSAMLSISAGILSVEGCRLPWLKPLFDSARSFSHTLDKLL